MDGRVDLWHATGITSLIVAAVLTSVHETSAWISTVTGNMDMLDSGYPRGVHDDVGYGCEPGLSATSSRWRLPFVPGYILLLLPKTSHHQVA